MSCARIGLATIFAFVLSGCWAGMSRQVIATILSRRGQIVYSSRDGGSFEPVNPETKLGAGSTLRTPTDGAVNIALIPGALAQISGNSELKIEELKLTKDGDETGDAIRERTARVELRRGGMVVLFDGFARFTIQTPQATITVLPGCLIRLDVDASRTRLTCVRGRIYAAQKPGQISAVDAGYVCEWPSDHDAVPAAGDAQGQIDATATLQVARELTDLEAAQRDHLPF
jgi:FecR protein